MTVDLEAAAREILEQVHIPTGISLSVWTDPPHILVTDGRLGFTIEPATVEMGHHVARAKLAMEQLVATLARLDAGDPEAEAMMAEPEWTRQIMGGIQ